MENGKLKKKKNPQISSKKTKIIPSNIEYIKLNQYIFREESLIQSKVFLNRINLAHLPSTFLQFLVWKVPSYLPHLDIQSLTIHLLMKKIT